MSGIARPHHTHHPALDLEEPYSLNCSPGKQQQAAAVSMIWVDLYTDSSGCGLDASSYMHLFGGMTRHAELRKEKLLHSDAHLPRSPAAPPPTSRPPCSTACTRPPRSCQRRPPPSGTPPCRPPGACSAARSPRCAAGAAEVERSRPATSAASAGSSPPLCTPSRAPATPGQDVQRGMRAPCTRCSEFVFSMSETGSMKQDVAWGRFVDPGDY